MKRNGESGVTRDEFVGKYLLPQHSILKYHIIENNAPARS